MGLPAAEKRALKGKSCLLVKGTISDLLEAGTNSEKKRIINGLDFKRGHLSSPPPPRFE